MNIEIIKTKNPRPIPKEPLGFGRYFSDHMAIATHNPNRGWSGPKIVPYGPIQMDPAASVIHYGQSVFEGMKAFKLANGKLALFRPQFNAERLQKSATRLCLPEPPTELMLKMCSELVKIDQNWIPEGMDQALYLRPVLFGDEGFLGVRPSQTSQLIILASPVGQYYGTGKSEVNIWVEKSFSRAAPGGIGDTKAAGNYASSLYAATEAKKRGYDQVLWLDCCNHDYVEEVGTMNIFFRLKDKVITPSLGGTILEGSTRACAIEILKSKNIKIEERKISYKEIIEAHKNDNLLEVFGTGTAAVITPVKKLVSKDEEINLPGNLELSHSLKQEISEIQRGMRKDLFNWVQII